MAEAEDWALATTAKTPATRMEVKRILAGVCVMCYTGVLRISIVGIGSHNESDCSRRKATNVEQRLKREGGKAEGNHVDGLEVGL